MSSRVVRSLVRNALVAWAVLLLFAGGRGLASDGLAGDSTGDLFRQANQAYDAGQFDKARDLYSRILAVAPNNPTVEYNLGNTYARLHDVARAVVHYERALRSNPRNADARANLFQIAPPSNYVSTSPLVAPFAWIKQRMNVNEWLWTTFVLLAAGCLAGALWALEFKPHRLWRFLGVAIGVLFLFSAGFSAARIADGTTPTGIVLADKIVARSGPGKSYLEAMELPAGAKVYTAGPPQRGWVRIRTPAGATAFVQSGDVEWI